jgi:short-subunit dehydrogenase
VQTVVITGLADGIGREVARLLARSKTRVAGFDLDEERIESLKKELEELAATTSLQTLDADRPHPEVQRQVLRSSDGWMLCSPTSASASSGPSRKWTWRRP